MVRGPFRLVRSGSARRREQAAMEWLEQRAAAEQLLVVAAIADAASELLRQVGTRRGAIFGWQRVTLGRLAGALAGPSLAASGLTTLGAFGVQALVARVIHRVEGEGLGRYAEVKEHPGFPVAMARALEELRMAGVDAERVRAEDPELAGLYELFEEELRQAALADRALVFRLATEVLSRGDALSDPVAVVDVPTLMLDVPVTSALERDLVAALAARCPDLLATVPEGDRRSRSLLEQALSTSCKGLDRGKATSSLLRLQRYLFSDKAPPLGSRVDESAGIFSAPGESRECVEVARRIRQEAERDVPFDRIGVLVHPIGDYRSHLEEALGRAGVPAHFARDAMRPDPAGRAFASLLACAAEDLSARRFAEYLSLGEVPRADAEGAPPAALPAAQRWVPPDEELVPEAIASATLSEALLAREQEQEMEPEDGPDPEQQPVRGGTLRAPRRWERLLNEAAVIGGHERWDRRLQGLASDLRLRLDGLEEPDDPASERIQRDVEHLQSLRAFALPLLEMLHHLPEQATWGHWIEHLSELASRALRRPQRVLTVLADLRPMEPIGPVGLQEVRRVLHRRLTEEPRRPSGRRYGKVFVGPPDAARGLVFDVVFVLGLAEKLFPRRIIEDPILSDAVRSRLDAGLVTDEDRVERERLALKIAVGAARERIMLSYPRIDLQHARPRVPSFYGLELLRAAQGRLPGFNELARLAERTGAARLSWPAPERQDAAIDDAEYDLALLERLHADPRTDPAEMAEGAAYLLSVNPHLGRAIRLRHQRWSRAWTEADGLVKPSRAAREALASHHLQQRSYSPTALQHFAACPYRFLLSAIMRLSPLEVPEPPEEMDPLLRGSLVHEVQFLLYRRLQDDGLLPVTGANLEEVYRHLEQVLAEVTAQYHDEVAPAIERVWQDGVAAIRADLREWLRLESEEAGTGWVPWRFEFSFGLTGERARDLVDPSSTPEPARLDCGIQLRGKIDLVERKASGQLRATDHKTGKVWVHKDAVIEGGKALQPVLYGLALQKLVQGDVSSGRLYYCTTVGGFSDREVPIDEEALEAGRVLGAAIGEAFERGFLPTAPAEGACTFCDYQLVCGPHEEYRTGRKPQQPLASLQKLRGLR